MGYKEEKKRLFNYVTKDGIIIELTKNRNNVKLYYKELEKFRSGKKLAIRYPGYKTTATKCDYCVYLVDKNGENPISHVEIMQDLYEKTTVQNYERMKYYVEAVARCGKDMNDRDIEVYSSLKDSCSNGFSFEELTSLMFYIAIQEDINYPGARYQGRKMCFYRYLEAIYCKVHTNKYTLNDAIQKAIAKGSIPKNWDDVEDLYDVVSEIRR